MDIFDKYDLLLRRRNGLLQVGADPFAVRMDRILSATEALINGRRTILAGTNNYLGLTFDESCIEASVAALREQGTGTTGSRIANGTYAMHRDLEQAIASLPGRAREVFVLYDVEGYTHEEVAGLVGISVGTSKSQLHRARMLLRKALS